MLNLNISELKCFDESCYQYSMKKQQICKPLIKPVPVPIIKIVSNFSTVEFIFCVCLASWVLLSVGDITISKAKHRSVVYKKRTQRWADRIFSPFYILLIRSSSVQQVPSNLLLYFSILVYVGLLAGFYYERFDPEKFCLMNPGYRSYH